MSTLNYVTQKYNIDLSKTPENKYIFIPDTRRTDLTKLFSELNFKSGAEIGVLNGEYSAQICTDNPQAKLYAIDPWITYSDYVDFKEELKIIGAYQKAINNLSKHKNCKIIRKTSMDAVKKFDDESLDFVYIDANHLLKYVVEDVVEWSKKVRKGGIVSGHDFILDKKTWDWCHVVPALDAYINAYNIDQLFILGKRFTKNRDFLLSWFFVKQ